MDGDFYAAQLIDTGNVFQAAFRVQLPWTVTNPDGNDPNHEQIIKEECYVFGFAPDPKPRT